MKGQLSFGRDLLDSQRQDQPETTRPSGAPADSATVEPRRAEPQVWSVAAVNAAARVLLESRFPPLWVAGEATNWRRAPSGHCYFTLKDQAAQIRCVMWKSDAARLPTDPAEGMRVRAFGALTLYERRGEYQLMVRRLEGEGAEGLWRLAFERLREKLLAEGLLAPERKRPLPRYPAAVGIVTSPSGAAIRDILTVIGRRAPWTRVVVCPARVQGDGAAGEIADAIRVLGRSELVDVIIVGRGGGSMEDLWAFNEEPVARAIAASRVPIVSAVGHEVDVTIADLVADVRAPTPSAAAESVVPDRDGVSHGLAQTRSRLAASLTAAVARRRTHMTGLAQALARAAGLAAERRRNRLAGIAAKINALSPLSTLRRGYAVALDSAGRVLRRAADFAAGRRFVLRVVDGRVRSVVEETQPEPEAPDGGSSEA